MTLQLFDQSKCFRCLIIWMSVLSVALRAVQSCDLLDPILRDFTTNLRGRIKTNENGNDMKIIEMLMSLDKTQLSEVSDCYNTHYGQSLILNLRNKFNGKLEQIVVALVTPEIEYDAKLIHDGLFGMESDSSALIDLISTEPCWKLERIRATYQKLYKKSLNFDLAQYTTGHLRDLLLNLIKCDRREDQPLTQSMVENDARELYSGNTILPNGALSVENILVTGSFERIRRAVYRYYSRYHQYYESSLLKKYDGDFRRALITIVRWSKGKDRFYAERLYENLNSLEADEHSIIRIIVRNIDNMEPIKKEFIRRHKISLEEAITSKITGQYAKALVILINKNVLDSNGKRAGRDRPFLKLIADSTNVDRLVSETTLANPESMKRVQVDGFTVNAGKGRVKNKRKMLSGNCARSARVIVLRPEKSVLVESVEKFLQDQHYPQKNYRPLPFGVYFKNSKTIVVPRPRVERKENPENRDFIDITTKFTADQISQLAYTLPCVNKFVESFMNDQPSRIVVFLPEVNDADVSRRYLSTVQKLRSTFILSGNLSRNADYKTSLSALIIVPNYEFIENSTANLVNLCGNNCKFAVILTDIFGDVESFLEEADNLVDILWTKRIANVAILGTDGDRLLAAKSLAYKPNVFRQPSSPILVGECQRNQSWKINIDIYAPMKMDNSRVHFAFLDREPYITLRNSKNTSRYWGLEVSLLRVIMKRLQLQLRGFQIDWGDGTTVEDEVRNQFENNSDIDLIAGGILWDPNDNVDFTTPYDLVQVIWLLPIYNNISLQGLITPFDDLVWFAVCIVLIFGIILKYILFQDMSLLETMALVLGVAWHKQPAKISSRLVFMSWVIFGYILTQFYLASLAGQLMAQSEIQMETMADLINSGLNLGGTQTHKMLFKNAEDLDDDEVSDMILKTISKKFIVFSQEDYEHQLHELMDGHNRSVALAVMLNVSSMGSSFDRQYVHPLSEALASYPLSFPVWRGLPYLKQINSILSRLIQSGVIDYLGANAGRKSNFMNHNDQNNIEDDNNLLLDDIAPAFLLLIIGYSAGGVCLFGEIVCKKLTEHKKRKKKKIMGKVTTMKMKQMKGKARNGGKQSRQNIPKSNVKVGYYSRTHRYP
ncbi:hypothetical protein PV325_000945 [Microctonus aethiopoides]|nr:hypothetical protein PV325_000945 [Microctonus aethiopoides]